MSCDRNSDERHYDRNLAYCRDDAFSGALHPGKRCYREIPHRTSLFAMPPGDQVCFDAAGNCEDSYDRVSPVAGRDACGICVLHPIGSIGHVAFDMVPSLFEARPMHVNVHIRGNGSLPGVIVGETSSWGLQASANGQLGSVDERYFWPYWYQPDQLGAGCSVLAGHHYSQAEVKGLLAQAGWPSNLIDKMSAIVMGESGGWSEAHNGCGENSWGLAQVYIDVHPEYTAAQMKDPIQNLRAAYKIYTDRGGGTKGFNAWGAFSNGSYAKFLGAGGAAVTPTPVATTPVTVPDPVSPAGTNNPVTTGDTTDHTTTSTSSHNAAPIAIGGGAIVALLGLGAFMLFSD